MIRYSEMKDAIMLVSLEGSLEVGKQAKLKDDLIKIIPSTCSTVVLDLSLVEFIDSACLGALIGLTRSLRAKGGEVGLANPTIEVRSIFQITRLDKIFKIYDSVDEALKQFSS